MSLRPDDRASRGKSPNRSRDRSRSREPPAKSKSSSSKSSKAAKSARFVVDEEDEEKPSAKSGSRKGRSRDDSESDEDGHDDRNDDRRRSMPGGFETEEAKPRYSTREPPSKALSLSSAGSYLQRAHDSESSSEDDKRKKYTSRREDERKKSKKYEEDYTASKASRSRHDESEEEDYPRRAPADRHTSDKDSRKYSNGVCSPRQAEMPSMPGFDNDYFGPPKSVRTHPEPLQTGTRHSSIGSVPYPMDMRMPGSPEDYSTPHAMMPAFPTFEAPRSFHPSDKSNYIPQPQSPPSSKDRYKPTSDHGEDRPHPPRSSTYPYTTQTREARPPEQREPLSSKHRGASISETKTFDTSLSLGSNLAPRMSRLSVSGARPDVHTGSTSGGLPPPSPLLEAYRGTYQTASPMPSPMMLPHDDDGDISDTLVPLSLSSSPPEKIPKGKIDSRGKRRAVVYDAEGDASKLAKALNHTEARPEPLIAILPTVTHDQLLHLRQEYKKQVKIGGRGVNLSKQVKSATSGNFGKAAYVTSLGRWESESYWANFWYQSHSSNRELLIEALMGRPNAEIRAIKESFRDKRYEDDLALCMEKELKADKFRVAVLGALEGTRQEETDVFSEQARNRDAETLFKALKSSSSSGGETAILEVVVKRSDAHLREVLKVYERVYQGNFAREALKKSNNLVGEIIAHTLNGAINRPARDCLLIRHALTDITNKNKGVELRYELLMSRLIRLHWDQRHLTRVKEEFKRKYGVELEREVKESVKGDFGRFCGGLLET